MPEPATFEIKAPEWMSEPIQLATKQLIASRNLACEKLTEKQLGDAIAQALASGDFTRHVLVSGDAQSVTYLPYSEAARFRALYYELLMAIRVRHEGENVHETALRYIKEAENFPLAEAKQCANA